MTILSEARSLFDEWMTAVTQAVELAVGRYARRPLILLSGESGGVLTATLKSAPKGPVLPDVSFRVANGRPTPSLPAD
jgi:general secretion pathway protein L